MRTAKVTLEEGQYVLIWGEPGHSERGEFKTSSSIRLNEHVKRLNGDGYEITFESGSFPRTSPVKHSSVDHDPQHRYDCGRCKFSWNCGLACSCVLDSDYPDPPESVRLDRLRAFLEEGDRFIKNRKDLENYIKEVWSD